MGLVLARLRALPRALPLSALVGIAALTAALAFGVSNPRPPAGSPAASASPGAPSPPAPATPGSSPSPSDVAQPSPPAAPQPAPGSDQGSAPAAPPAACSTPGGGFPGSQLTANYPVALAWSPDGRLFWAERTGTIKVFEGGAVRNFASVSTSTEGERGLLGLAISGNLVFALYSNPDGVHQAIVRWTDHCGMATNPVTIAAGLPAGGDCCHKGGRLAVSPDGHLFATIGDTHDAVAAQDRQSLLGKVLRFDLDGGGQMVWTSGLRNPFGIAFAPDGTMALTNNGPSGDANTPCGSCGDEFYVVGTGPGVDYQWPYCWGYSHAFNGPLGNHPGCTGLPEPQYSTEGGPNPKGTPFFVAPTGMTWSTARAGFVFCANSNGAMYQYLSQRSVVDTGVRNCSLDVKQGPGGALYTSGPGGIYRQ